jgi:alkylhydroperoxidase/carboxymuconolactone decarboxylase family protein YurZ
MARIEGNPRPGLFARLVYWVARRQLGHVPEPLRITAHNPSIFTAMSLDEAFSPRARVLDARRKELASILVAMRVGCPF